MIFRSEDMSFFELKLTLESGWYFIEDIGRHKIFQIIREPGDNAQHSIYNEQIKQCRLLLQKLDQLEIIAAKLGRTITRVPDVPEFVERLNNTITERERVEQRPRHTMLTELTEAINTRESLIDQINQNYAGLIDNREKIVENYNVLSGLRQVLPGGNVEYKSVEAAHQEGVEYSFGFYYLCGTIQAADAFRLQRSVFRLSRENALLRIIDLEANNPNMQTELKSEPRKIYFIVFPGGSSHALRQRIMDVLKSFDSRPQVLPINAARVEESLNSLQEDHDAIGKLILKTKVQLLESLAYFTETDEFSRVSPLEEFRMLLIKELSIYAELSKFRVENKIMSARCWVPTERVGHLYNEVARIKRENEQVRAEVFEADPGKLKPPTYFKLSDLTRPFQEIVDTYGIPRYKEVNPGLFTVTTFPYLFGVMFGDIGHGGILAGVGIFMVKFNEQMSSRGFASIMAYRYIFLMMGCFAFYCGLIYNDFLGIPWKLFSSCYTRTHMRFEKEDSDCTYPLGFDPVWFQSQQEIAFLNSFKMKISIVIGVTHMLLGIAMKAANSIYFRNFIDFFFEFIPQFIFMVCTFGYMCAAIIIKWLKDWGDGSEAPSIISIFINMGVATPGSVLWGDPSGIQQTAFQQSLFLIAFVCVFIMLFPKPIILAIKAMMASKGHATTQNDHKPFVIEGDASEPLINHAGQSMDHDDEQHDISEIFVHQMIEVIEFVLGSISNTASYLRLWALSLAHGQLAKVFLDMTVLNQIKGGSPIFTVIGFPVFVCCTVFVLLLMDLMECFLHTLRLHWVEFQNKFFKGDGYNFEPFDIVGGIKVQLSDRKLELPEIDNK